MSSMACCNASPCSRVNEPPTLQSARVTFRFIADTQENHFLGRLQRLVGLDCDTRADQMGLESESPGRKRPAGVLLRLATSFQVDVGAGRSDFPHRQMRQCRVDHGAAAGPGQPRKLDPNAAEVLALAGQAPHNADSTAKVVGTVAGEFHAFGMHRRQAMES
jgi:hypothetical protein